MAGEVTSGRPMARHAVGDDGGSGVPNEARESVLTEDRPFAGDLVGAPPLGADGLDELARIRATAEQAAMVAEIDAAAAAGRAAAAIAAAARAAEEAEVAAEAAARASAEAADAVAAEERTTAALQTGFRSGVPAGSGQGAWVLAGPDGGAPRGWSVVPAGAPTGRSRAGSLPPGRPPANSWPSMFPVNHGTAPAAPWDVRPDDAPTVEGAAAGGRAARRHAAEAAEAQTTVIPVNGGDLPPAEPEVAEPDPESDEAVVAAEAPPVRRLDRKRPEQRPQRVPRRPVVAVIVFGVLLIVAGLILALAGPGTSPPPTVRSVPVPTVAPDASAPPANGAGPAAVAEVDPKSDKAVAFLSALRAADIATSRSGSAETETAAVICEKLGNGVSKDGIARTIPAALPSVPKRQAADVVELAQELYC
jgi:hypothetical protein